MYFDIRILNKIVKKIKFDITLTHTLIPYQLIIKHDLDPVLIVCPRNNLLCLV